MPPPFPIPFPAPMAHPYQQPVYQQLPFHQQQPYYYSDARAMTSFPLAQSFPQERQHQQRSQSFKPSGNRSQVRLVIERIPPECCTIAKVADFFGRFGNVVNVTVQAEKTRAKVQFGSADEAQRAYESPQAIFDNRFVKIYFDANDLDRDSLPAAALEEEKEGVVAKKKQDAIKAMLELQKHKQETLARYISQQKELLAKLETSLNEAERPLILQSLKSIGELIQSLSPPKELNKPAQGPILRGGPRPNAHTQPMSYHARANSVTKHSLDLRPTTLHLNPIPMRIGKDAGALRKFFEPYGQVKSLSLENDTSVAVTFQRRNDAEKALYLISKTDLGEPFELQWAPTPPKAEVIE